MTDAKIWLGFKLAAIAARLLPPCDALEFESIEAPSAHTWWSVGETHGAYLDVSTAIRKWEADLEPDAPLPRHINVWKNIPAPGSGRPTLTRMISERLFEHLSTQIKAECPSWRFPDWFNLRCIQKPIDELVRVSLLMWSPPAMVRVKMIKIDLHEWAMKHEPAWIERIKD